MSAPGRPRADATGEHARSPEHHPRPEPSALAAVAADLLGAAVELVEPLRGGARRDSYRVVTAAGSRFVLRLDRDAASLAKEAALTRLVAERVPVAEVVAADLDGGAVGVPLTISVYADGAALDERLDASGDDDAAALGRDVGRTLAAIGGFGFPRAGALDAELVPTPFQPLPSLLLSMGERVLGEASARDAVGPAIADGFRSLLEEAAPILEPVTDEAALVHSDFNGKNLVVRAGDASGPAPTSVIAVLDWEFSFAGPPLADVGNMLRRQERLPPAYVGAFVDGFDEGGGALPPGWRSIAAALDAIALLDFLDRGAHGEHGPMYAEACALIERAVSRGDLAPLAAG